MTGANRRLIGIAWPLVFGVFWLKTRKRLVDLERGHAIEILTLTLATVYAFTFLLKREIGLIDTVVLGVLFLVYITLIAKAPTEEPHLIGPARTIGTLPRYARYLTIGALLVYAAIAIFAVADPFAEGLIETGSALGVDEFLMVQLITLIARRASLRTLIRTTREVAAEYRRGAA